MSSADQAIYDAVRSKISNGNIGDAIQTAIRDANLSHYAMMASEAMKTAVREWQRPSVLFRPVLEMDGNKYIVLYGKNVAQGCVGYGDSASEAMIDFDRNWYKNELQETSRQLTDSLLRTCPFCNKEAFYKSGLKHHLQKGFCDYFNET